MVLKVIPDNTERFRFSISTDNKSPDCPTILIVSGTGSNEWNGHLQTIPNIQLPYD